MALWLFRERTFLDATYYLFHLIQTKSFVVEHQRYVLAISQILPLLAIYLKLPLKFIMMAFSLNQACFMIAIAALFDSLYKKKPKAMLPVFILGFTQVYFMYYCPLYEIWYGAFLLLLLFALIDSQWINNHSKSIWLVYPLLMLIFTAHPSLMFSLPIIFWLSVKKFDKSLLIKFNAQLIIAILSWFLIKYFFISDYEKNIIARGVSASDRLKHMLNPQFHSDLWKLFREHYLFLDALIILTILFFIYQKLFIELALFIAWIIAYLIFTAYANDATTGMFIPFNERVFTVLVAVVAFISIKYLPDNKFNYTSWLIGISALLSFIPTMQHREFYSHRIKEIDYWIQSRKEAPGSIITVDFTKNPSPDVFDEWSIQMEILLHSSLQQKTYYIMQPKLMELPENAAHPKNGFIHLRMNEWISADEVNKDYFNYPLFVN